MMQKKITTAARPPFFIIAAIFISGLVCQQSRAGFILDDFYDGAPSEATPLEPFRSYEDLFTPQFGQETLLGAISLVQNSGLAAELRYDGLGSYDFSPFDHLILQNTFLEPNVTATLKADNVAISTGMQGFNSDGENILIFEISPDLVGVNKLSFLFETSGDTSFSITSTSLMGGTIQAIPEPTSLLLVSTAFACGAGCYRLRKRR